MSTEGLTDTASTGPAASGAVLGEKVLNTPRETLGRAWWDAAAKSLARTLLITTREAEILAVGVIRTMELADTEECPLCGGHSPPCIHVIAAHEIASRAS